jgi:hypothetical protein
MCVDVTDLLWLEEKSTKNAELLSNARGMTYAQLLKSQTCFTKNV